MTRAILYEINTRCWLNELSDRAGRQLNLAEVPGSEFETWVRHGFTHIWLMGVWTLGALGQKWSEKCYGGRESECGCAEIAGSPYAILRYEVSQKLGGNAALAAFRRRLHQNGLKLVLDFVPNHTALDHQWVKSHPEYFVNSPRRRNGGIKPFRGAPRWFAHGDCGHGTPWVDTLQLEYRNPELRAAMMGELISVASRCDGVRCDMAMLVLNDVFRKTWQRWPSPWEERQSEFWSEVIARVRERDPQFLFLAEVYWDLEQRLQELGFDYTYDKRLYDRIVAHDGWGAAEHVRAHAPEYIFRSSYFIENHDEPRVASLLSRAEHRAAAFLISVLPGMSFYHEGQFSGARVHANVHFSRRGGEPGDDELEQWYERLFAALKQSKVGRAEALILNPLPAWESNPSHENFVLIQWGGKSDGFDLAAVNLGSHASQCFAPVSFDDRGQGTWAVRDRLSAESHVREGEDLASRGLFLDLPAHGFCLFEFVSR